MQEHTEGSNRTGGKQRVSEMTVEVNDSRCKKKMKKKLQKCTKLINTSRHCDSKRTED